MSLNGILGAALRHPRRHPLKLGSIASSSEAAQPTRRPHQAQERQKPALINARTELEHATQRDSRPYDRGGEDIQDSAAESHMDASRGVPLFELAISVVV